MWISFVGCRGRLHHRLASSTFDENTTSMVKNPSISMIYFVAVGIEIFTKVPTRKYCNCWPAAQFFPPDPLMRKLVKVPTSVVESRIALDTGRKGLVRSTVLWAGSMWCGIDDVAMG